MTPNHVSTYVLSLALITLVAPLTAQTPDADVTSAFKVEGDFEVRRWAASPDILNPTNMAFDARGRLFVTEAVNYRDFRNAPEGRLSHPRGDRVRVLEDRDGDGVCDSSIVFAEDEDLVAPLGIAVIGPRVFVSCSPRLLVYTDTDGDGRADEKEVLLDGFGGRDHDHGLHAVVGGADGRLWFNAGNAGPHIVTDRSGWTLRSGSIYNDGGRTNLPGLKSDDGRVWTGGIALSMRPDGTDLRVHSYNFRNCYEITVDAFGDVWQNDNDDDGNRGCRLAWVPRGANMGYMNPGGTRSWGADRRPGQSTQTAHWHQDDPGVFPAGEITGAGAPTGIVWYEDGALGERYRNTIFSADAGRNLVYAMRPKLEGAGFSWRSRVFIEPAEGGDRRFRPSDVAVGPDGALYVADWFDPVVGGHLMRDKKGQGAIYRIAPRGTSVTPPAVDVTTVAGALAASRHPDVGVRYLGRTALASFGERAHTMLVRQLKVGSPTDAARALWLLAETDEGKKACRTAIGHESPRVRITAFRALVDGGVDVPTLASELAADPHPAVRREVALHLRDIPYEKCRPALLALAKSWDGRDRTYLEALGVACDGKEAAVYADLVADMGDQPLKWSLRMEGIAWRLHPPASVPALAVRALEGSLGEAERRRAIDALGFCAGPDAAAAMVRVATHGPSDLRPLAHFWLRRNDSGIWRGAGVLDTLGGERPAHVKPAWKSGVVRKGTKEGAVDLTGVERLWLVVTSAGDGNSCDWADWVEPTLVGPDGEHPLTSVPWVRAEAEWGKVAVGRNCVGGPLRIDGRDIPAGIGTHASSEILYALPPGRYDRLTFRVGPDDGGTGQGGATSIAFEVFTAGRARDEQARLNAARLADASVPERERRALASEMAVEAEGARALLRLAARDELSDAIVEAVRDRIHRNPDFTVRALAGKWFPRPAVSGEAFPPLPELLKRVGDPQAGRRVFFGKKAGCSRCHVHDGRGEDVGPDLTTVHTKYARAEILDAVLSPSAGIAFGYEGWMIETRDGDMHTGFLLADGPVVILKTTEGRRLMIPKAEVAVKRRLTLSTMPDNVALGLTPDELMDVIAFLGTDVSPTPEFGPEAALFNGVDLRGWTHHLSDPAAKPSDVWSVRDGVLECRGRPVGYLRTEADYESFELTLEWRFDPAAGAGNSGVLMRLTGEDKVWPRSIEAQLMHRNAGDIWNIGEVPMVTVPERTSGRRTEKAERCNELPLGEWNRYRLRLHGGTLTLEVNGVVQNRAWDCEVIPGKIALQSEGAMIQFRNVKLREILN